MSTSSVTALRKAIHVKLAGASALVAALGGTKFTTRRRATPIRLT
jgi:hypothetical protein